MDIITDQDYRIYFKLKKLYEEDYDELIDDLYHYMNAYINDIRLDIIMCADCIENLLGIREHEEIISYINTII